MKSWPQQAGNVNFTDLQTTTELALMQEYVRHHCSLPFFVKLGVITAHLPHDEVEVAKPNKQRRRQAYGYLVDQRCSVQVVIDEFVGKNERSDDCQDELHNVGDLHTYLLHYISTEIKTETKRNE
jgi:hypothetical protein